MARRGEQGDGWSDETPDDGDAAASDAPNGWEQEGEQWKNRLQVPERSGRELTQQAEDREAAAEADAERRAQVERMARDLEREIQKVPVKWSDPPKRTRRRPS